MRGTVLFVVGARPQFVKLAPLLRAVSEIYAIQVAHTGQHYDWQMSGVHFDELGIPRPDYDLGVGSGSHGAQTGRMLAALEEVLLTHRPDAVVVFGDTNSTLAGSLASVKLGIPCAHVEAGLRSWNRSMPEEINRVVSDHTCDALYAPTHVAMRNLSMEGLEARAKHTGDIMVDSLMENLSRSLSRGSVSESLGLHGEYWLLTLHRPYNVDDPLRLHGILSGLDGLGRQIVFPVHPRTRAVLAESGDTAYRNVRFVEPLGYLDFIGLQHGSDGVFTDSGGVQKEAYLLGRPCVTLRTETEWVETVESGWNCLVPPLEPDWLDRIHQFRVPMDRPSLFGTEVSLRMRSALRELIGA